MYGITGPHPSGSFALPSPLIDFGHHRQAFGTTVDQNISDGNRFHPGPQKRCFGSLVQENMETGDKQRRPPAPPRGRCTLPHLVPHQTLHVQDRETGTAKGVQP